MKWSILTKHFWRYLLHQAVRYCFQASISNQIQAPSYPYLESSAAQFSVESYSSAAVKYLLLLLIMNGSSRLGLFRFPNLVVVARCNWYRFAALSIYTISLFGEQKRIENFVCKFATIILVKLWLKNWQFVKHLSLKFKGRDCWDMDAGR